MHIYLVTLPIQHVINNHKKTFPVLSASATSRQKLRESALKNVYCVFFFLSDMTITGYTKQLLLDTRYVINVEKWCQVTIRAASPSLN